MSDRTIRMTVSYDGTDFSGWQKQEKFRTPQGEIEKALEKMHNHPVSIVAAGRTDQGVHAVGQVVSFNTDIESIPADRFQVALNKLMPQDVRIVSSSLAEPGFNARFDAAYRRYKYFFRVASPQFPHLDRYAWHLSKVPDIRKLNKQLEAFHGELDCTTFASSGDLSTSNYRYINHAFFYVEGDYIVFDISANAFLWKMIRSIVGTLIEIEYKNLPSNEFMNRLEAKDRSLAGVTAPPKGLFLWDVGYYPVGQRTKDLIRSGLLKIENK